MPSTTVGGRVHYTTTSWAGQCQIVKSSGDFSTTRKYYNPKDTSSMLLSLQRILLTLEFSKSDLISSKIIHRRNRKTMPSSKIISILKSIRYTRTKIQNLFVLRISLKIGVHLFLERRRNDRYRHDRLIRRPSRDMSFTRSHLQSEDSSMTSTKSWDSYAKFNLLAQLFRTCFLMLAYHCLLYTSPSPRD